jgi:hypothetical protein
MKEDAEDPSFFNFFLGASQIRLFCCLRQVWVATGCIFNLQAVQNQTKSTPFKGAVCRWIYQLRFWSIAGTLWIQGNR